MAIAGDYRYAGFWWRFLALLIDTAIMGVVQWLVSIALGVSAAATDGASLVMAWPVILLLVLGPWLYYALLECSNWQATIGKKICGLIVVDENGNRISFGRATGRYFAKIISAVIFYIGFLMAGWTQRKRALHDMIAGTLVLKQIPQPHTVQLPAADAPIRIVQQ
jgi:uncharacterized RDD family membrane protein YckC